MFRTYNSSPGQGRIISQSCNSAYIFCSTVYRFLGPCHKKGKMWMGELSRRRGNIVLGPEVPYCGLQYRTAGPQCPGSSSCEVVLGILENGDPFCPNFHHEYLVSAKVFAMKNFVLHLNEEGAVLWPIPFPPTRNANGLVTKRRRHGILYKVGIGICRFFYCDNPLLPVAI